MILSNEQESGNDDLAYHQSSSDVQSRVF